MLAVEELALGKKNFSEDSLQAHLITRIPNKDSLVLKVLSWEIDRSPSPTYSVMKLYSETSYDEK